MKPIRKTLLKAVNRLNIDLEDSNISIGVPEDQRSAFEKAVLALKSVAQGVSFSDIEIQTDLKRQQVSYLIKRLEVPAIDGEPFGLRALFKGAQKARQYTVDVLNQGRPVAGSLKGLFKKYADICDAIRALVFHGVHPDLTMRIDTGLISDDLAHDLLLTLCEKKGIKAPTYPFCGDLEGKRSLSGWIKSIKAKQAQENHRASMERRPLESELRPTIRRAYARVQADAHSVAVKWKLRMPSLRGEGFIDIFVKRLWIITLIECGSGSILGHSIAFSTNYSGSDLMRAVRRALVPWQRLSGYEHLYKAGDGMPSGVPDLQWRAWDLLQMDSAMAHTCSISEATLERTVNCVVEVGPIDNPDVRAQMEGFYAQLQDLFKLLPGFEAKPHERGPDPTPKPGPKHIHFDLLVASIELIIARYNGSHCPGTSMTHLEVLKHSASRSTAIPRRVPEQLREFCEAYDTFDTATVGKDKHGHPVLRWENASYSGIGLAATDKLIDEEVLIAANSMDLRRVHVWLMRDGSKLGILEVEKRYRATAHSATTRKHLKKLAHADSFFRNAISLPLAFRQMVEAREHKRSADYQELARLVIEQVFSGARTQPAAVAPSPVAPEARQAPQPIPAASPVASPAAETTVIPFVPAPPAPTHLSDMASAASALKSL